MNEIQFIQQHGVDKARDVVEGAPESATHFLYDLQYTHADYLKHVPDVSEFSFDLWDGQAWKPFLRNKKRISLSDLKKMVESMDLVGKYHSIDHAKNHYNNLREAINQYQYEKQDVEDLSRELGKAITDYQLIYGVK